MFSNFYLPTQYFNDVCRVCLSKHKVLVPIKEIAFTHSLVPNGTLENVELTTVFLEFCDVQVNASDNKPQKICEFCINMASKAFNFFQLFRYSNSLLEKKLEGQFKPLQVKADEQQTIAGSIAETNCLPSNVSCDIPSNPSFLTHNTGDTNSEKKKRRCPISQKALKKIKLKLLPTGEPSGEPIFECKICLSGQLFYDITEVIKHLKVEHLDTQRCILCLKYFKRTSELLYHVAAHSQHGLICRMCHMVFESKEDLEDHKKNVDHTNTRKCLLCPKTFKQARITRLHMETVHLKKQNYQCEICGKMFKYHANVLRHEKSVHGGRKFLCQHCGKSFSTVHNLKAHEQKNHDINQGIKIRDHPAKKVKVLNRKGTVKVKFKCKFCQMKFRRKRDFFTHSEIHPEFKEYNCDVCGIVFETRGEYVSHYRYHEKFQCTYENCSKMFISKVALSCHNATHIKRFRCEVCDLFCRSRLDLSNHMNIHTGARPYKCAQCEQGFKQPTHLKVHMMSKHGDKKPYQCKLCEKSFTYPGLLNYHIQSHRGEKPFPCLFCKRMFRDTTGRRKHVKNSHPKKIKEFLVYKETQQEEEIRRVNLESETTEINRPEKESDDDSDE